MVRMPLVAWLLVAATALTGCGLLERGLASLKRKPKPQEEPATQDTVVGIVESVNPEQKFVLVRTDMRMAIAPGTRLETRPLTGMTSVLTVTPERKLSFVSADIARGLPARGDVVVMPPAPAPPPAASSGPTPPEAPPAPVSASARSLPPPVE